MLFGDGLESSRPSSWAIVSLTIDSLASGEEGSLMCQSITFKVGLFFCFDFLVGRADDTMVGAGEIGQCLGTMPGSQRFFPCRDISLRVSHYTGLEGSHCTVVVGGERRQFHEGKTPHL